MQKINQMLKPVIMDQHGLLLIFDSEDEKKEWIQKAGTMEKVRMLQFDCLNDLRSYIDRLTQTLWSIETLAEESRKY